MSSELIRRSALPALLTAVFAFGCILALSFQLRSIQHSASYDSLLQRLKSGTDSVIAETHSLLSADGNLARIQAQHDQNIAQFQTLLHGNLKQGLPGLVEDFEPVGEQLNGVFEDYSQLASSLIQQRGNLDRFHRNREQTLQNAQQLAERGRALLTGLKQIKANATHLQAAYDSALILENNRTEILAALLDRRDVQPLPLGQLEQNLDSISTDKGAPASVAIRRSAANLLKEIESYSGIEETLQQYHAAGNAISDLRGQLIDLNTSLNSQFDSALTQISPARWSLYLALLLALAALTSSAYLGFNWAPEAMAAASKPAQEPDVNVSDDTSSPHFAKLVTDKNKLMNDIRPLGEGILYLKADEHLESTSDLARCLNQSREALAHKIEGLKNKVRQLEQEAARKEAQPDPKVEITIDTAPVSNLTYRALAELEGLQRKIKALNQPDNDVVRYLVQRCNNIEGYLDEIRVRVKKGWQEQIQEALDTISQRPTVTESAQVDTLVAELVRHMDEFQTQAPQTTRRKR
ncbi:hypothetical protein FT643_02105 [Ketobacter sp. MCCC 1A13808]|uniref:hypothetical protein n=1 Tax=Ketobacter sp. MCCC 1A13808 TaxID=2602738 RepID=UPI0012EB5B0B|nr:hypothetical protein [Ketobacter sp. MCCC 1A13808]MVF10925.1 hypothetical protein [Ketobacter sp. MCCC 1A13808]